jgi:hypothetical protein
MQNRLKLTIFQGSPSSAAGVTSTADSVIASAVPTRRILLLNRSRWYRSLIAVMFGRTLR